MSALGKSWIGFLAPLTAAGAMAAMTGGALSITLDDINAGGDQVSGGTLLMHSAIGSGSIALSGGGLTVTPGVLAAAETARANLSAAHAYPTPFIPSQGHTSITFTQLPSQATIHVYTLSGRLVKTLAKNDSTDSLQWTPVANEQGSSLVSGVYLFVIDQPGFGRKTGKFMIIR